MSCFVLSLWGQTSFCPFVYVCCARDDNGVYFLVRGNRVTVGSEADGSHPVVLRNVQRHEVEEASLAHFKLGPAAWINQADCIDMDCDGECVACASLRACLLQQHAWCVRFG
jgi:hypothetical protein